MITPISSLSMREGLGGGHFYDTFRQCPRKWYLKYVLGFKENFTGKALLYGSAIHEAFKVYYEKVKTEEVADKNLLVETALAELDKVRDKYYDVKDHSIDRIKAMDSLSDWYSQFGQKDLDNFEVLENEQEHIHRLKNNLEVRIRPDRIIRDRHTDKVYIVDTKTTGVSLQAMFDKTARSDQPTVYAVGIEPLYPTNFGGWITDCLYSRGRNVMSERSIPVTVDTERKANWEISFSSDIEDLINRYMLLKENKFPSIYLFPARKCSCSVWGCPFSSICDKNISDDADPQAYGFSVDEWKAENYVHDLMVENINNLKNRS